MIKLIDYNIIKEKEDNRVRDPVHGFIHFSNTEKNIIDCPEIQRLRNIKQLALTSYVYPGANHSRFEHTLGVMELVTRMYDSVYFKNKDLIEEKLNPYKLDGEKVRDILRLAAIFHDAGHLPFSHAGEEILPTGIKHEDLSIEILENLKSFIESKEMYPEGTVKYVKHILKGDCIDELVFAKEILSGSIDADRTDYLIRDSLHCGVDYGKFDFERLIETLTLIEKGEKLKLAINDGGIHAVESLILARFYMFTQVINHRTRRIYDIYLDKILQEVDLDLEPITKISKYDDNDIIQEIKRKIKNSVGGDIEILAKRILYRDHHSLVYETDLEADPLDSETIDEVVKNLEGKYPNFDIIADKKAGKGIHDFYIRNKHRGQEDVKDWLWVITRNGEEKLITDRSTIIDKIPEHFLILRIYAYKKEEGDYDIKDVKDDAKKMFKLGGDY